MTPEPISSESPTHEELRLAAIRFAKRPSWHGGYRGNGGLHLTIIASEAVTCANDIPDVIGWNSVTSALIECKASRADFFRDADKPQRQTGTGMGASRYYMTPKGLVTPEEVPAGWGLIEVDGKEIVTTKRAEQREIDAAGHQHEKRILLSLIRRIKMREFLIISREPKEICHD